MASSRSAGAVAPKRPAMPHISWSSDLDRVAPGPRACPGERGGAGSGGATLAPSLREPVAQVPRVPGPPGDVRLALCGECAAALPLEAAEGRTPRPRDGPQRP